MTPAPWRSKAGRPTARAAFRCRARRRPPCRMTMRRRPPRTAPSWPEAGLEARSCAGVRHRAGAADGELQVAGEVARGLRPVLAPLVVGINPRFELTRLRRDDRSIVGDQWLSGMRRCSDRAEQQRRAIGWSDSRVIVYWAHSHARSRVLCPFAWRSNENGRLDRRSSRRIGARDEPARDSTSMRGFRQAERRSDCGRRRNRAHYSVQRNVGLQ